MMLDQLGFYLTPATDEEIERAREAFVRLIVERVEGENAANLFDQDPLIARSVSLQLAGLLGKIHAIDPRALGIATAGAAAAAAQIRSNLAKWKRFWERNRQTCAPLPAAALLGSSLTCRMIYRGS
jgi:aminoglycoside phosphotransferase (APT) family kinase protein